MSDLIDRYQNLLKTGFEYAEQDKGNAPTSNFEIYMGHFASLFSEIHTALSEAEQRVKDARREALEEAASWHDHEIARLNLQIEENNEFGEDRSFKHQVYAGNEYCRKLKSHHKKSAKSIRALIPSDPHDAEVKPSWQDPSIFDDAEGRN